MAGAGRPSRTGARGPAGASRPDEHETTPLPRAGRVARAIIGGIGELMITAGLVIALFLVWQLWWTDVAAGRDQAATVQNLEQQWGDSVGSGSSDGGGSSGADPTSPGTPPIAPEQHGDPPPIPAAPAGDTFALLHVPAFGTDPIPVAEGVGLEQVLNTGRAGHYPGTAMPGEIGNYAVAGHRTTYGKPFHLIDRLREGDEVVVETKDAYFVYRVTSHEIVMPTDVQVVGPVPDDPGATPTARLMTMTACHPLYSARERYVVHLELASWNDRADGIPRALATPGAR